MVDHPDAGRGVWHKAFGGQLRWTGGGGDVGPHAHGNAVRHVRGDLNAEGEGGSNDRHTPPPPQTPSTTPSAPTTGPHSRHNDTTTGTPAAATVRARRPDAAYEEGRPGGTVQGPSRETATRRTVTEGGRGGGGGGGGGGGAFGGGGGGALTRSSAGGGGGIRG